MELDVSIDNESLSIEIENPYHLDMPAIMGKIKGFAASLNVAIDDMDIEGLLPRMVRGIAGCESGCPANAKGLVSQGFRNFELNYIEGGILSARAVTEGGSVLQMKMFPEF